jgi:tetratricopeptide (TPR) repeat protein
MHAGTRASDQLAWETAVTQFGRAAELLAFLDPADPHLAGEVLLALGEAQQTAGVGRDRGVGPGDSATARATFERALRYARLSGSVEQFARGALGMAGLSYNVAVDGSVDAILEEALERLGDADSRLRVLLLGRLAVDCMQLPLDGGVRPAIERAWELSDEAVAVARRLDDPRTLADALMARVQAQFGPDTLAARIADLDEIARLPIYNDARGMLREGEWYWHLSAVLAEQGDLDASKRALEPFNALATAIDKPHLLWGVEAYASWWSFRDGQWEAAADHTQATLAYGPIDYTYVYELFYIRREQGRLAEIRSLIELEVARYHWVVLGRAMRAMVWLATGSTDLAARELDEFIEADVVRAPHDYLWLPAMALLSELCLQLEHQTGAAALVEALAPYAELAVHEWQTSYCLGSCSRYLGLAAMVIRDWDVAEHSFAAALAADERMRMPAMVAHTRADWAEMLLRRGEPADRDRIGQLLDAAHATAQALAMPPLIGRVAELRARWDVSARH